MKNSLDSLTSSTKSIKDSFLEVLECEKNALNTLIRFNQISIHDVSGSNSSANIHNKDINKDAVLEYNSMTFGKKLKSIKVKLNLLLGCSERKG